MLSCDRKDYNWIFAPLGFVHRDGIGQNNLIQIGEIIRD
jgi:hypothetical protein